MARKQKDPSKITPQMNEMTAEFAGKQYEYRKKHGKTTSARYKLFEQSILKLLLSNFKWYGLAEQEVNHIENSLINTGSICAIQTDFDLNTETPSAVLFGTFGAHNLINECDFYGFPLACSCTGKNGKVYYANSQEKFIVGFDTCANEMSQIIVNPIRSYVSNLALELDDAYSSWKVACETRKLGMVFECDDKSSAKILKQTLNAVSDNAPHVIIEGNISNTTKTVFSPPTSTALSEFHMNFMNVWGSVMDLLGLENNSQNKRERLVVSEAEMNRSLSRYLSADRLRARKNFVDEINSKFGLNVEVENYLASVVTETPEGANIKGTEKNENVL